MKQQVSPEVAKQRLKIILLIIGAMILFIIYKRITAPKERPLAEWQIIENRMNEQLDSLVTDFFKDTVKVISYGDYEILTKDTEAEKRERYIKVKRQYLEDHSAYETVPDNKTIGKEYDKMNKSLPKEKPETAYFRAVSFEDQSGIRFTGYQRTSLDLKKSYLVMIQKNTEAEQEAQKQALQKMEMDSYENNN